MSFWHHGIIGAIVPWLVKRAAPFAAEKFKLAAFDEATRQRVSGQVYPRHYGFVYGLWLLLIVLSGFAVFGIFAAAGARSSNNFGSFIWLGIIHMIGAWLILGAILDAIFWQLSSEKFRDYATLRQIKSNSGYPIQAQIVVLLKLGALYYIVLSPIIILLILMRH